jgi:transcriptional regulator NrdR family protein
MRGGYRIHKEICPRCGSPDTTIQGVRGVSDGTERRKECKACRVRWMTKETFLRMILPRKRSG